MTSAEQRPSDMKQELEEAAWLFEQLTLGAGLAADRPQIRRALSEAAEAWPIVSDDRWWKWLVEGCRTLGMKCKVIDCTFEQMAEMARQGAKVIARAKGQTHLKLVSVTRRGQIQLLEPLVDKNRQAVSPGKLKRSLGMSGRDDIIRCLVIEPLAYRNLASETEAGKLTPLGRYISLLIPEWPDVWLILIFSIITGMLGLATPLAVETLVNTVAFGRLLQPVIILALVLFAFLAFSAAITGLKTYVVEIIQQRLYARVAADLAYRLPRTKIEALDGLYGRELVNRFFDIVTVQKVTSSFMLDGLSLILNGLIGMAVLAFYHPWLLGFDIILIMVLAFIIFVLGRGAVYTSIKESKQKYRTAAWLEDLIGASTTFRYRGASEFALERTDQIAYDYIHARKAHFRILMRQIVFALGSQAVASTVLLGMGGWLVISGQLTLGQLVAAELIVTVIVGSFAKLGKHMEIYYDLMASIDKLGALFDLPMEPQDGVLVFPADRPASVAFHNVSYANPKGKSALKGVSFEIPSGARMMLTGASGTGKSYLLDLLFGLRTPASGHILINGMDPRDLRLDELRRHVVLIRNVELFEGTIAENVHLERPNVSTNDVRDALEQVGLLDMVLKLKDGLDTHIVSTGFPLSANECRKLMIARGIVARPRLLLIDDGLIDAMSDEDAESLTKALVEPDNPWTLILVTGRQSIAQYGTVLMATVKNEPDQKKLEGKGDS